MKILTGSSMSRQHVDSKNNQSPKGLRAFDLGGVGLGIVAALENSRDDHPNRIPANKALFHRNSSRSKAIPIDYSSKINNPRKMENMISDSFDEEYTTIVTFRGKKESYTKVYASNNNNRTQHNDRTNRKTPDFRAHNNSLVKNQKASVFHISPEKTEDFAGMPKTDFLSSCNMCRKKLHGHDIYMYRGEKAFCSSECRYNQIVIDERKEKYCSTEASRHELVVDVSSSSPYVNGPIYTTGILAS